MPNPDAAVEMADRICDSVVSSELLHVADKTRQTVMAFPSTVRPHGLTFSQHKDIETPNRKCSTSDAEKEEGSAKENPPKKRCAASSTARIAA